MKWEMEQKKTHNKIIEPSIKKSKEGSIILFPNTKLRKYLIQ